MKTIGIVGGLTWHSTLDYYRLLNEEVNRRLGGYHAAKIILNSVDFAEIKVLTEKEDWDSIAVIMCNAARSIEAAGASCVMLGANTMHNIADVVALSIKNLSLKKVALLGTKYTMQMSFYKDKLTDHGIATIVPSEENIEYINKSIYLEFSKGIFLPETKKQYLHIIDTLVGQGAEGIIFGCTEIPILVKQEDCNVPVFDTAYIHTMAAVDFALG